MDVTANRSVRPSATKLKPTGRAPANSSGTSLQGSTANSKSSTKPKLSTKLKSASDVKPVTGKPRPSATDVKANVRASPANSKSGNNVKEPSATIETLSAQLDVVHQKVVQRIQYAEKAMSTARANVEKAKASKDDQNNVVSKASEVVSALLAPSRQVVNLLAGHGALFPPCKRVSKALAALIKTEVGQRESDVRVAIVHFDLARALVHFGTLSRKARPAKSLAGPLGELLNYFESLIEEFGKFCEAYYETKASGSRLKHLLHWNGNKDRLNGFADRIAVLKKDLIGQLSHQAEQHPWKYADELAQLESRLAPNRAFYGSICDANEETAKAFLSHHGGEAAVRIDSSRLKQLAGAVGEDVTQGLANVIKDTAGATLKQYQKVARTTFASKLQSSLDKWVPGSQQKTQTKPTSGPREPIGGPSVQAIRNNSVSARDDDVGDDNQEVYFIWEDGNELGDDGDQEHYLEEDEEAGSEPGRDYYEDQEPNPQEDVDVDEDEEPYVQENEDDYLQEDEEAGSELGAEEQEPSPQVYEVEEFYVEEEVNVYEEVEGEDDDEDSDSEDSEDD